MYHWRVTFDGVSWATYWFILVCYSEWWLWVTHLALFQLTLSTSPWMYYKYIPNINFPSWRKVNMFSFKTWCPGNDVRRASEKAVCDWPAELPGDWPHDQGQPERNLMIGQIWFWRHKKAMWWTRAVNKGRQQLRPYWGKRWQFHHSSSCCSSHYLPCSLPLLMARSVLTPAWGLLLTFCAPHSCLCLPFCPSVVLRVCIPTPGNSRTHFPL